MRFVWLLLGMGSFAAGAALAWHHPLWPAAVLAALGVWCAIVAWRPGLWILVLPAGLPFLNLAPWTGWLVFEEFDLLLLGAAAGGYCRRAWDARAGAAAVAGPAGRAPGLSRPVTGLVVLLGALGLLALHRGFADAGGFSFGWFQGYEEPLNSLRIFKSLLWALLLLPLLQQEMRISCERASRRLAYGVVAGLAGVSLVVVWERAAFPGLLDFSSRYRTTALFWEMHVGGAAIDGYLAMATPFVVWALRMARNPRQWAAVAALALLTGYACLTTFSRGVYLAVALPLAWLGLLWCLRQGGTERVPFSGGFGRYFGPAGWRTKAGLLLAVALAGEVFLVLGSGSFMRERMARSDQDLGNRLAHWRQGLDLLDGPADWWLGKGLGRLPANYARAAPQGEFPGRVRLLEDRAGQALPARSVSVSGPQTLRELGGLYGLTQRVAVVAGGHYRVSLDVRVRELTGIYLEVCERHLLYAGDCQASVVRVGPAKTAWQRLEVPLEGPALRGGSGYAPRSALFALSVVNPGAAAEIDNASLSVPGGGELLENGNFSQGLAHWFPVSQHYFLPWHIDNLFLEWLIERGLAGVLVFAALMLYALRRLAWGAGGGCTVAPHLAASLCAALLVGLVSSLMDVPRVAFLLYFLIFFAILLATPDPGPPEAALVAPIP